MNYFEFTKRFPDENSAIDFIIATKYKDGYACPKCGCMHKGIYHQKYNHRFMYCNWGWSGESENGNIYYGVLNGYYESELFDTTKGPEMLDDKDTHVSASNDLRGWWCYRFITY